MTRARIPVRLREWTAAAVLLSTLAACGGGGGGEAPAPAQGPPPPPAPSPAPTPAPAPAPSQPTVVVPAPVGISAYIGDESNPGLVDATGRDARFNRIFAMALDAAGNTYVIDQKPESGPRNPVIRRITPEGAVTTLPKNSCYSDPRDLTVGADGHLYILDVQQGAGRICRQTPAGEITLVFTQAPQTSIDLVFSNLARGPGNDLFAATRRAVYRVTPGGTATFIAGSETFNPQGPGPFNAADGTGAAARFGNIAGIAADAAGNVYAGDGFYGIRKVTPQGVVTTVALMPELPGPISVLGGFIDMHLGIAVQADGSVIVPKVSNTFAGSALLRVAPNGQVSTVGGSENLMRFVPSLATDAAGNITYSAINGVGRLLQDGTRVQLAGRGLVGGVAEPTDDYPAAVDASGNLYTFGRLTAGRGLTLRKRNPQGELIPYGPGRDTISLAPPDENVAFSPIAVTANGTAYVSYSRRRQSTPPEYYDTEIYKVAPNGETARILFAAAGEPNFGAPAAIAPAPDGTLYFIDAQRAALRKLNTDGSVVSVTPDRELIKGIGDGSTYRIGVSPTGKVYLFSEFLDTRLFTVNDAGRLELLAGQVRDVPLVADGTGAGASFALPTAPVFDEQGNLYTLDNNTLRRITPAGVVTTLAGVPNSQEMRMGATGTLRTAQALARSPDGIFYVRAGDAIVRIRPAAP